MKSAQTAAVAMVMAAWTGLATGQVLVPPPAQPQTPPEYVPAEVPIVEAPATPAGKPPIQAQPRKVDVPNLPWKHWEVDDRGLALPLTEPLDYAALKRNPMVDAETMKALEPYIKERRQTYERLVLENVELMEKLEAGLLENVDTRSRDTMSPVISQLRPLAEPAGPRPLGDELRSRGLLTAEQAEFQSRIKNEYLKKMVIAPPPDLSPEDRARESMGMMLAIYRKRFDEPRMIYRDLLVEASGVLDRTGVALQGKAAEEARKLTSAKDDAERLAVMKAVLGAMPVADRQTLLKRTMELRAKQ